MNGKFKVPVSWLKKGPITVGKGPLATKEHFDFRNNLKKLLSCVALPVELPIDSTENHCAIHCQPAVRWMKHYWLDYSRISAALLEIVCTLNKSPFCFGCWQTELTQEPVESLWVTGKVNLKMASLGDNVLKTIVVWCFFKSFHIEKPSYVVSMREVFLSKTLDWPDVEQAPRPQLIPQHWLPWRQAQTATLTGLIAWMQACRTAVWLSVSIAHQLFHIFEHFRSLAFLQSARWWH